MRKTVLLFVLLAIIASCKKNEREYTIVGHVNGGRDGDTVTLACSPDGIELKELSSSVIKNGCFVFKGHVDGCKVGYICYDTEAYEHCSLFFLESGNMEIVIDSTRSTVHGTALNELSNEVEDTVEYYISELETIEQQYYSGTLSDEELSQLGAAGFNLQERLISYMRNTVQDNIGNLLGLYMLVVYNEFFTTTELNSLIARIPSSSIDKDNNPFYDIVTEISRNRLIRPDL